MSDIYDRSPLSALPPDVCRRAARTVAVHALDLDDAVLLLDALGLDATTGAPVPTVDDPGTPDLPD